MQIESRDSVSLKPAELDELGQLLHSVGLAISDAELDRQVEAFPLAVMVSDDDELQSFMLGSLERIGGTPSILWGLGATRRGRHAGASLRAMTAELSRRAAISFPDEDVLVATRLAQAPVYVLLSTYANIVPRAGYVPSGEDRAWGRRLAKRFGCDAGYDDRTFRVEGKGRKPSPLPVLDGSTVKATGGAKVVQLVGQLDPARGQGLIAFGWAIAEDLASGTYAAAR
jgi:hypothetical protein